MIIPSHPMAATVMIVADNVKNTIQAAGGLGCAMRDTLALEDGAHILKAYGDELKIILPEMLTVVTAIDHKRDLSQRAMAKPLVERLRTASAKYAKAFQPGRLSRVAVSALFPKAICEMVAETDVKWRVALGVVEESAPDEIQVELIGKLRDLMRTAIPHITDCMYDHMVAEPNAKKLDGLRLIEKNWLERVAAGEDQVAAYEALAQEAMSKKGRETGVGKQLLELKRLLEQMAGEGAADDDD